jgi:hypothetical protein
MEGKTEEEVERYAEVFKERYKELNGKLPWKCEYFTVVEIIYRIQTSRGGGTGGTGGGCGPPYLFEFFLYSTNNMILSSFL